MRVLFAPASSEAQRVLLALEAVGVEVDLVLHKPGGKWRTVKWLGESFSAALSNHAADVILTDACNASHITPLLPEFFHQRPVILRPRGDYWQENANPRIGDGGRPRKSLRSKMLPSLYRRADAIVPVSKFLGQTIMDRCGIAESKITAIREPVDMQRFRPAGDAASARKKIGYEYDHLICLVSDFVYQNKVAGIERFLPVLHALVEQCPDVAVVIAGDGPLLEPFCDFNRQWMSHPRIIAPGFVHNIELLYQASDFLAHFSFLDTLALVLFEAWACGIPVVVNDYPVFRENVRDRETGYILGNDADPEVALPILIRLLYDAEHRREMGNRGREYVREYADPVVLGRQYLELFNRLLA